MIQLRVYGKPAAQGSKRHVGHGRMIEMSKDLQPWREAIKWEYLRKYENKIALSGPVFVGCLFFLERPKSLPKKVLCHVKRPDVDKLARAVLDSLTACGAWVDDSQVDRMQVEKRYADAENMPGVVISVEEHT